MGLLLSLIGWNSISEDTFMKLAKHKRLIAVCPHTSELDFMYYIMYVMSLDIFHTRARSLVNSRFMSTPILGQISSLFGARSVQNDGSTFEYIYDELSEMDSFYFFISPKGSIAPNKWKTGYYNLAKKLNAEVVVVGLDYVKRELIVGRPFYIGETSFNDTTRRLQREMSHIHQLNVENLEYESPQIYSSEDPNAFGDLGDLAYIMVAIVLIVVILLVANR